MILLALIILILVTIAFVATSGTPGKPLFQQPFPGCGAVFLTLLIFVLLAHFAFGPIGPGNGRPLESGTMQTCRTLALAMFQYSNDNDGHYPDGASSTEVFQKLVDGNYIADPAILFVPLPGKVAGQRGIRLKPENVSYDVTGGADSTSPEVVPVVFLTGFRLDYRAGASAISRIKPFPCTISHWFGWSFKSAEYFSGLPVTYKSNNAFFLPKLTGSTPPQLTPDGYGIVPNVIAPDFDAHGQIYRQLTPDGVLK